MEKTRAGERLRDQRFQKILGGNTFTAREFIDADP
jgi:hypothetical protein